MRHLLCISFLSSCLPVFLSSLICAVALPWPLPARAEVAVSIEPAGVDLNHLQSGQTATIDVRLSGLESGDTLSTLEATVVYDETVLGTPDIVAGPIVPDPLNEPLDFLTAEKPGYAETTFLTFAEESSRQIDDNGLFFSFDVTALRPGQGELIFDWTRAEMPNPADRFGPFLVSVETNAPVSFTVVPEPSSVLLLGIMGAAIGGGWVGARRRRIGNTRSCSVT